MDSHVHVCAVSAEKRKKSHGFMGCFHKILNETKRSCRYPWKRVSKISKVPPIWSPHFISFAGE